MLLNLFHAIVDCVPLLFCLEPIEAPRVVRRGELTDNAKHFLPSELTGAFVTNNDIERVVFVFLDLNWCHASIIAGHATNATKASTVVTVAQVANVTKVTKVTKMAHGARVGTRDSFHSP